MLRLTAFLVLLALIAVIFLTGCVYKGAKVTEGTDLSVGLSVPGTDGVAASRCSTTFPASAWAWRRTPAWS
jgi:hypothetical protein